MSGWNDFIYVSEGGTPPPGLHGALTVVLARTPPTPPLVATREPGTAQASFRVAWRPEGGPCQDPFKPPSGEPCTDKAWLGYFDPLP